MAIEEPVLKLRPSRIGFIKEYSLILFLIWIIVLLKFLNFGLNVFGLAAATVFILVLLSSVEIERLRNVYKITPSHVIVERGIISKKRQSVFFSNIADISVQQNITQRLCGFGDVVLGSTSGRDYTELKFKKIKKPKDVAHTVERLLKEYEEKEGKKIEGQRTEKKREKKERKEEE